MLRQDADPVGDVERAVAHGGPRGRRERGQVRLVQLPQVGAPVAHDRQEVVGELEDPFEALLQRGVTDGLPVIPPTPDRVVAMLDATARDAQDVVGVVESHLRVARHRAAGTATLRIFNPAVAPDSPVSSGGWSATSTVIDIVNDDMPYVVESIVSAITAAGVTVHRVLHR